MCKYQDIINKISLKAKLLGIQNKDIDIATETRSTNIKVIRSKDVLKSKILTSRINLLKKYAKNLNYEQ